MFNKVEYLHNLETVNQLNAEVLKDDWGTFLPKPVTIEASSSLLPEHSIDLIQWQKTMWVEANEHVVMQTCASVMLSARTVARVTLWLDNVPARRQLEVGDVTDVHLATGALL